jgi:NAD+ diphosphatase
MLTIVLVKQQVLVYAKHLQLPTWQTLQHIGDIASEGEQLVPLSGEQQLLDLGLTQLCESDLQAHDLALVSLREFMMQHDPDYFQPVARAWQYALFLKTHQFCGQCGHRTRQINWEMAKQCDNCGHRTYPRISPCIIVAIRRGPQILLAQGPRHVHTGIFSTLAGFVESGETLEQAVAREVMEEVGVQVKNIQYFDSQPWPFPHSLMVGFTAEYDCGEIVVDGKEIVAAQWFDLHDLPPVPPSVSIAGRLIAHTQSLM